MILKDQKLAFLRRRLIHSLRYIKMYMEEVPIQYQGEEIEVNVRPSLPFKMKDAIDTEAAISFGEVTSTISMPTMLKEALETTVSLNAGDPLAYPMNWNLKSRLTNDCPVTSLNCLKPDAFNMDKLCFNSDFKGDVDFIHVVDLDTMQKMVGKMEAKMAFISMPHFHSEITAPVDIFITTEMTQQYPLPMKAAASNMLYADNFKVDLQYIRPIGEYDIKGIGRIDAVVGRINLPRVNSDYEGYANIDFTPSMFQRTTMANLGEKTLTELENMPTEVGYVLITYTDDDYPWEV